MGGVNRDEDITKEPVFVFAGRLEENKGFRTLVEFWTENNIGYFLHIYGDGNLKELAEKAASENPAIQYMGFRPQIESCQN